MLSKLLHTYVTSLGEAFVWCLPGEAKHLDAATLAYTIARYELQDAFTDDDAVTIFSLPGIYRVSQVLRMEINEKMLLKPSLVSSTGTVTYGTTRYLNIYSTLLILTTFESPTQRTSKGF